MTRRLPILVTDGDERAALAAARSLVAAGYDVHVAARGRWSLAGVSRGVRALVARADPLARPAAYAGEIGHLARDYAVSAVLPVTDPSVEALLEHRGALPSEVVLPLPALEVYRRACDKAQTLAL